MEDTLVLRDGLTVLAYGDLGAGNVFWRPYGGAGANINALHYLGDNKMLVAYSNGAGGGVLGEIDYDNAGVDGAVFYSNRINLGDNGVVKRIEDIHDAANVAGTTRFQFIHRDVAGNENTIEDREYTNQITTETKFNTNIHADIFQLKIVPQNDDTGHRLIRIKYEPGL